MNSRNQKIKKVIGYWRSSAQQNWQTTLVLFKNRRFDACLFFCHLTLEKMLKGLVVRKINDHAPFIHDLKKLAYLTEIKFSKEQLKYLEAITDFNIAGRYADQKYRFYKRCTKEYTQRYLSITKELILCLKKEYQKK